MNDAIDDKIKSLSNLSVGSVLGLGYWRMLRDCLSEIKNLRKEIERLKGEMK